MNFSFTYTLFVRSVVLRSQLVDGEGFLWLSRVVGSFSRHVRADSDVRSAATLPTERSQAGAVAQLNIDRTLEQSHRQCVALANSG